MSDEPPLNRTSSPNNITFLEPNSDLLSNFSFKIPTHINLQYKPPYYSATNIYLLEVIEQPHQCRMSGVDEKDRRPIDPAPIVKLTVINCNNDSIAATESEGPFYVVHASLWSPDMTCRYDFVKDMLPFTERSLIGSLVSSSFLLKDLQGETAYYFSFPDLSVRMLGQFRLEFSLVHLAMSKVITEVFSEPFTVYSAKAYPGMKESSEISRHLARQGLKLTVRSLVRGKKDEL